MFSSKKYPIYRAVGHLDNAGNPCHAIEIKRNKELSWKRLLFGENYYRKIKLYYSKEEVLKDLRILNYKAFIDKKERLVEENNHSEILENHQRRKEKLLKKSRNT